MSNQSTAECRRSLSRTLSLSPSPSPVNGVLAIVDPNVDSDTDADDYDYADIDVNPEPEPDSDTSPDHRSGSGIDDFHIRPRPDVAGTRARTIVSVPDLIRLDDSSDDEDMIGTELEEIEAEMDMDVVELDHHDEKTASATATKTTKMTSRGATLDSSSSSFSSSSFSSSSSSSTPTKSISATFHDLTIAEAPADGRTPPRNPPLTAHEECRAWLDLENGRKVRPGALVAIGAWGLSVAGVHIDYLRVRNIIRDRHDGAHRLRGTPFARLRRVNGWFGPRYRRNEVAAILAVDGTDPRPPLEQSVVEVEVTPGLTVESLAITNEMPPLWSSNTPALQQNTQQNMHQHHIRHHPHPQQSFSSTFFSSSSRYQPNSTFDHSASAHSSGHSVLVCRWFVHMTFDTAAKRCRPGSRPDEIAVVRATPEQVEEPELLADPATLRACWRGHTVPGGSFRPFLPPAGIDVGRARLRGQKYTLFDSFCGAGGVSRGAQMAGLKVQWGVDNDALAVASYKANFVAAETSTAASDVASLLAEANERGLDLGADVLHLSPPCQPFSPAHTTAGPNDERNKRALLTCGPLVERVRPRVFTLEQTFGLLKEEHGSWFRSLVRAFTALGYSVRWKVVFLPDWGLPQRRSRLVMIGSCPGEVLPGLPGPTHAPEQRPGLLPYRTVADALTEIPPGFSDNTHNPNRSHRAGPKPPYDPHVFLNRCITTGGGQNYHPSGTRDFTPRELAALQGFPLRHRFAGDTLRDLKRQVGNAFGPVAVRVLYSHIERHLLEQDGMAGAGAGADVDRRIWALSGWTCARTGRVIDRVIEVNDSDNEVNDDSDVEMIGERRLPRAKPRFKLKPRPREWPRPGSSFIDLTDAD